MAEPVGQVRYDVEIQLDQIQGQLTALDAKLSTQSKGLSDVDKKINAVEKSYGLLAKTAGVAGLAIAGGFTMAAKASFDQVKQVENATFALRAYEKDAQAVNTVLSQLVSYARSDMGTLFQRDELFQAASNLKGFGDATSDLSEHVQILSKGVALGMTTFDEFSQIVGRSAASGKLTAQAYDQLASRGIILESSFRGAAITADELFQAIDNAIDDDVLAGRADTIEGRMIKLQSAWRDLGAQILGVDAATSTFIKGGLGDSLLNLISRTRDFIAENRQMIIVVGTMAVTFGGLVTAVTVAVRAFTAIRAAMVALGVAGAATQARMLGVIGVLSAIAGLAAGAWIESKLDDAADSAADFGAALPDVPSWGGGAEDAISGVGNQLKKLEDQSKKINEDFRYNLAQLVQGKQENISKLQQTLKEQDKAYQNSYNSRLASFNVAQNKEAQTHGKRVKELQTQIDFLTRYNNTSNQRRLSELQFALERENAEYEKQTKLAKGEFDAQTEAAKTEYEARRAENQKKLNEEMALLNKHRKDVQGVRNVILLDEIEMLKKQRQEQLKNLERQRQDSISSNAATGTGAGNAFSKNFNKQIDDMVKNMSGKGRTAGKSFWSALIGESNVQLVKVGWSNVQKYGPFALFGGGSLWTWESVERRWKGASSPASGKMSGGGGGGGWATGGYTGRGGVNEVAGAVHRGEYVLPQTMVNQTTGTPDIEKVLAKFGGGGSGQTININVSGVFATSKQEQRKVAEVIVSAINENQRARGIA